MRTKRPRAANRKGEAASYSSADHAAFVPYPAQAAKERRAPGAHGQQAAKENHRIDAEPPVRPVSVRVEIQPDRKLIEGQRRAYAISDRHQPAEEDRHGRMRAPEVYQPAITHQQQNQDAPDQVMDVPAMNHDPLEVAFVVHDSMDQNADARKGEQERD